MLGRYTEFLLIRAAFAVFLKDTLVLPVNLFGIKQKFCAIIGQHCSPAVAVKDRNAQFLFKLLHGAGQRWLRDIEFLCRFIKRFCFCNCNNIMKLCQCHNRCLSAIYIYGFVFYTIGQDFGFVK